MEHRPNSAARPNKLHEATHLVILLKAGMHILFDISALCFIALVFTAVAIARHVKTRRASSDRQLDFAHHLFAATDEQDSGTPHTVPDQTVSDIPGKKAYQSLDTLTAGANSHEPQFTSPKRF
jgi:hypothetical protein